MFQLIVLALAGVGLSFALNLVASQFYPGGFLLAQAGSGGTPSIVSLVMLSVLTVMGIVSSFIFERTKQRASEQVSIWENMGSVFSDFRLIAALFASPLIFNGVYSLVHQNPQGLSDFLLAYQNGFFWQSVIAGATKNANRRNAGAGNGRAVKSEARSGAGSAGGTKK